MNSGVQADAAEKQPINKYVLWLGGAIFLAFLAYLALHYARLTSFPIGDDPAIHIHTIKSTSYRDLLGLPYPLPLAIYKFVQQITGMDHARLFIYLISAYLFIAGVSLTLFLRKIFNSWPLAVGAALIFVMSRWVSDALRMGLLAETFSWSVLFILLLFLTRRNLIGTIITTGILVVSHPFATMLYAIMFVVYSSIVLIQPSMKEERPFILKLLISYLVLTGLVYLAKPDIIQRFLEFKISDPPGWGDRTLDEILNSDDEQRMFIPYIAGLGLFAIVREWSRSGVRILLILLIISFFFSLNYLFGVSFIPFRFYVYLEMLLAVLASYAFISLFRNTGLSQANMTILVAALAVLLSIPNYNVNQTIGHWQATRPEANAILLPDDKEAIAWLAENTESTSSIMATRSRGIWIIALADRNKVKLAEEHYTDTDPVKLESEYLYYARGQKVPESIVAGYHQVFSNHSVSIWQVDDARP